MPDSEILALQEAIYDSKNPTRRWLHRQRRDWLLARIAGVHRAPARVLEVGPGSGLYLRALAGVAGELYAADIEACYLENARRLSPPIPGLTCVRDDIMATALPAAYFDLILCTEVIEHLPDSAAALANLCRLLAPGGRLILTTPQRYSPLELCGRVAFLPGMLQLLRLIYREPVLPTGHINLLTERELKRQLAQAGLTILEEDRMGFYLPVLGEFGGARGQRLLAALESRLRHSRLSWLLWTQCYVLGR